MPTSHRPRVSDACNGRHVHVVLGPNCFPLLLVSVLSICRVDWPSTAPALHVDPRQHRDERQCAASRSVDRQRAEAATDLSWAWVETESPCCCCHTGAALQRGATRTPTDGASHRTTPLLPRPSLTVSRGSTLDSACSVCLVSPFCFRNALHFTQLQVSAACRLSPPCT